MADIRIGTSGWSYAHWDKVFYPEELAHREHLEYYATFFDTVEINSTFYNLPTVDAVKNWRLRTPKDFVFSVKASRFITHRKKLIDCEEPLANFYERIEHLKEKLGPILIQLPPSFAKNKKTLLSFIDLLKKDLQHTFEFRHDSWYEKGIYNLLKQNNIALCITDLGGKCSPLDVTADFVYVRLHGPQRAYKGRYGEEKIEMWKERIIDWFQSQNKKVYMYFDNDEKSYAVKDALSLKEALLIR